MNLYSWLDAERLLASNTQNFTRFPEGIADIRVYSEAIEIDLIGDDQSIAFAFVKAVFGNSWQADKQKIELAYGPQSSMDVEIITQCEEPGERHPRPLWKDLGYEAATQVLPKSPEPFEGQCKVAAFHSFKGGVGRTTSLLTWFKALQVNFHRESKRKRLKVLLVDADLEAPGLTYLFKDSDKPDVSWIQFLEASHYPAVDQSEMVASFARELDRYTKSEAGFEYCLLPAFSSTSESGMAQLMNISVRPEHLARSYEQPWRCTDMLQKLGNQLQADIILIDLRAGLSELSSPLLFDPRVERFVVTTLAEQAITGTEFILNRLTALANNQEWQKQFGEKTLDPRVITTFINEELKKTDQYKVGIERLTAAYMPDKYADDNANATVGLEIIEGEFSSQLLNLGTLDSALSVIEYANPLLNEGLNWARDFFDSENQNPTQKADAYVCGGDDSPANKLYELSAQLVYAEQGKTDKLLLTTPLRNLAQRHASSLPQIVSIGAKGSGKTFNYIQLCRRGNWKTFLEEVDITVDANQSALFSSTFILPFTHSKNTVDDAEDAISKARLSFYKKAGAQDSFKQSKFTRTKDAALRNPATDWLAFWEKNIIDLHNLGGQIIDFEALNEEMKKQELQTIVVIDGIEDLFPKVGDSEQEALAVKNLLELPNRLREIRNCAIGIVIFIREDYVEAVTAQNLGQFVERYEPYQLQWDADAFLRLVYWTCGQAGLTFAQDPVANLTTREISVKLHVLWGLKLGSPSSREAYSVRWVYAALCDLKGRLQARDVVRFLKYASKKTRDSSSLSQLTDRVLMPQAMRNAMNECSSEKVDEAKKELAVLGEWIAKLGNIESDKKTIPFSAKAIDASMEQLEKLIEYGIVYEDKKITEPHRYYLPESYRQGLGFTMSKGGRPKVQAMLKDSLGKIPVDP